MPLRTCIACRRKEEQGALIRIARGRDGRLGRCSNWGRGAYVCPEAACLESALAKGRLERALRSAIAPEERDALRKELLCELR